MPAVLVHRCRGHPVLACPTADQSHPWHAASTTQQAAVASSRHGEGGGGIQKLPTRWPCPQNQGHDAVSSRSWSRGWTWGWWLPFFDRMKSMRGLGLMQRLPLPVLPFCRLNAWCACGEMTWNGWSDKSGWGVESCCISIAFRWEQCWYKTPWQCCDAVSPNSQNTVSWRWISRASNLSAWFCITP